MTTDLLVLPNVSDFCVEMTASPGQLCVTFPGGATLCAQTGFEAADLTGIVQSLMGSVNAALMPLIPIFNVMAVIEILVDLLKAIPALVGVPPDPTKFLKLLPELVVAVEKLLAMLPQLSIPVMVVSILDVLIVALQGIKNDITAMINAVNRAVAAATKAATLGNVTLAAAASCAQANLEIQFQNKNAAMGPLNQLIGLVNFFMDLIGLGCIPTVPGLEKLSNEVTKPLDEIIKILSAIRDAIPITSAGAVALPSPCS